MSIKRIKKGTKTPFSVEQFYLIEASEGFFNFIERETLVVISCNNLEGILVSIANILRRYKNYELLKYNMRKIEYNKYTERDKEEKRRELQKKGEPFAHLVDELISNHYKNIEETKKPKRILAPITPISLPVENSPKTSAESVTATAKPVIRPKKRIKRL